MKSSFRITLVPAIILLTLFLLVAIQPVSADECVGGVLYNTAGKNIGTCSDESFQDKGIFGCNQTGAYAMSVGSLTSLGSNYVPVSDSAVTENTGYITYKECILDGIIKHMAENATANRTNTGITGFLTGRDGEPRFPVDLIAEMLTRQDESRLRTLQGGLLNTLNPAFQGDVIRAIARNYMAQTRASNQALACPYPGNLGSVLKGATSDVWGGLTALMNPACNPLGAYQIAQEYAARQDSAQLNEMLFRLQTGGGVYGVESYDPTTGRYRTATPGSIVSGNVQQLLTSGFRQLESATEIDQVVGALFSGLGTHAITDAQGLSGVISSSAGQPSYLDQIVQDSTDNLQGSILSAANAILKSALKIENQYLDTMTDIASKLTDTAEELQDNEDVCWDLIIENVCTAPPSGNTNTCTAKSGGTQLTVVTSTKYSEAAINDNIVELAEIVDENVNAGTEAVKLIQDLITAIGGSSSKEEKREALIKLDSLVAQNAIHNPYDLSQATEQKKAVNGAMAELLEDTAKDWGQGTGWCNVDESSVIQMWTDDWKN